MLAELSGGLGVTIHAAGLLITFGAVVLCVGSPVTAWLTSRIERRTLLTVTLLVLTLTNAASAFAPDYNSLLDHPPRDARRSASSTRRRRRAPRR